MLLSGIQQLLASLVHAFMVAKFFFYIFVEAYSTVLFAQALESHTMQISWTHRNKNQGQLSVLKVLAQKYFLIPVTSTFSGQHWNPLMFWCHSRLKVIC
jgi:hypothetical protein